MELFTNDAGRLYVNLEEDMPKIMEYLSHFNTDRVQYPKPAGIHIKKIIFEYEMVVDNDGNNLFNLPREQEPCTTTHSRMLIDEFEKIKEKEREKSAQ